RSALRWKRRPDSRPSRVPGRTEAMAQRTGPGYRSGRIRLRRPQAGCQYFLGGRDASGRKPPTRGDTGHNPIGLGDGDRPTLEALVFPAMLDLREVAPTPPATCTGSV